MSAPIGTYQGKTPPHSTEAEQSVLGAVLLRQNVMDEIVDVVRVSDFFHEANGTIFDAMCDLHEKRKPIDPVTLGEKLRSKGMLEQVGGLQYIISLPDKVVTTANIRQHARIIANSSTYRAVAGVCMDTLQQVYNWDLDDAPNYASDVQGRLDEVVDRREQQRIASIREGVSQTLKKMNEELKSPRTLTGVSTGFFGVDQFTQGLQPSDLIIVAGRPSMGKTAVAMNMAVNAAKSEVEFVKEHGEEDDQPRRIAVFSLEMSTDKLIRRMLAVEAGVPGWRLMNPKSLSTKATESIVAAGGALDALPIVIDDTDGMNVRDIVVRSRRLNRRQPLSMVVVDYLQIVKALPRKGDKYNRDRELGEITAALKGLAKELQIPVLLISQLNRGNESRQDKRPQLSDLRESGAIEQDADVVAFIHREAYYDEKADRELAELIFRKQRNGPLGTVLLRWEEHITRFSNTAEQDELAASFEQEGFDWDQQPS